MTDRPTRRDIRNRLDDRGGDGEDDWPEEVEITGVPATPLDEDGHPIQDDEDDARDAADPVTVTVPPMDEDGDEGGADAPEDREECVECSLNPIDPRLDGPLCLACQGLPRRDWPPYLVDPDGEEGGG